MTETMIYCRDVRKTFMNLRYRRRRKSAGREDISVETRGQAGGQERAQDVLTVSTQTATAAMNGTQLEHNFRIFV